MSGNSVRGSFNFSDLTLSLKNELNHLIPTDNQSDEDTDDFLSLKRYTIQAGKFCLVKQNNGLGQNYGWSTYVGTSVTTYTPLEK